MKAKLPGVSVIEVLIAAVIVGLVLTSLMGLMTTSVKNSDEADLREAAARIAQDGVEIVRRQRDTLAWSQFNPPGSPSLSSCNNNTITRFGVTFSRVCVRGPYETDKFALSVTVSWNIGGSNPQDYNVTQTFYRYR